MGHTISNFPASDTLFRIQTLFWDQTIDLINIEIHKRREHSQYPQF